MKKFPLLLLTLFYFSATHAQNNSFYVKTGDSLAFLNYGLGTDRLGGAKMGFLDSNIILKVTDSFGTQYKIQLAEQHSAWIEKANTRPVEWNFRPPYISGNWLTYGDSAYDYVSISLPAKLPYRSNMEIHPARIVLDLYGVVSNTNWITQRPTTQEIKNVWYEQIEDDVMRVYIELNHDQHWGYHIYYETPNRLTIRVKRQPASLALKDIKIAIDAGHGGDQTGTSGIRTKVLEKNYTLLFAQELQKTLLDQGAAVVMTRDKDTTLSMFERIRFLQKEDPNLLVSIHFNDASNDTTHGVSTYYRYVAFRPLSVAVINQMVTIGGLEYFGNVGSFNFSLNGPTEFPNCLVEVAFLSNPEDEQKIIDPAFRKQVAQKIMAGIEDFLKQQQ